MNRPANFFKHAERDAGEVLEDFQEGLNDAMLYAACVYYQDITSQLTPTMVGFMTWASALRPDNIDAGSPKHAHFSSNRFDALRAMSRQEQLEMGRLMVERAQEKMK